MIKLSNPVLPNPEAKDPYSGFLAVPTIFLFLALIGGYLSLYWAYTTGFFPGWLCGIMGSALAYGMFTIVHEASHGNIAGGNRGLESLETMMGWSAAFLFFFPYSAFVVIHLRHHAHTNDPEQDPDGYVKGNGFFSTFFRCVTLVGHYYVEALGQHSKSDTAMRRTRRETLIFLALQIVVVSLILNAGAGWAYFFVVLMPALLAAPFLGFFFDWLPHYPHDNMGKYHNTRVITIPGMEWVSLFQSYHLIHHLYPRVPFYKYKAKFKAIETLLRAKEAPIEGMGKADQTLMQPSNTYTDLKVGVTWHYALKVAKVEALTADSAAIHFQQLNGQPFHFKAGQYLVLSKMVNDKLVSRCYSICSAPASGQLTVGVKRVPNGLLSNALLDDLQAGMKLNVAGPFGSFALQESAVEQAHCFIAGGSGITPMLAMIQEALDKGYQQLYLLYGCRSAQDVMFKEQLLELAAQYPKRFHLEITYELLDATTQQKYLQAQSQQAFYYLCGPAPMMTASETALQNLGIPTKQVISEAFAAADTPLSGAQHLVLVDGANYKGYSSETILEAALRQDYPLPHACKMGQCGTCKAQLIEGKVSWKEENQTALLEKEKTQGYILTCMCHPASEQLRLKL